MDMKRLKSFIQFIRTSSGPQTSTNLSPPRHIPPTPPSCITQASTHSLVKRYFIKKQVCKKKEAEKICLNQIKRGNNYHENQHQNTIHEQYYLSWKSKRAKQRSLKKGDMINCTKTWGSSSVTLPSPYFKKKQAFLLNSCMPSSAIEKNEYP